MGWREIEPKTNDILAVHKPRMDFPKHETRLTK